MKTIIFLIGLVLILNVSLLISQQQNTSIINNIDNVKTIEEFRYIRFQFLINPTTNRPNPFDTDRYIYGIITLEINKEEQKEDFIKEIKKEKQQNLKFKSTYLDFTILQEENIS